MLLTVRLVRKRLRQVAMSKPSSMRKCSALACKKHISHKKLMCASHWAIVPWDLKKSILDNYSLGQEITGRVTPGYRVAVGDIVKFIAFREGIMVKEDPDECEEPCDEEGGSD